MSLGGPPNGLPRSVRWTPARLIVFGAALGLGPIVLDALVSVNLNLAFLSGAPPSLPVWLLLLDVALVGLLVPVGVFLAVCGIVLSIRLLRPHGPSLAFRTALSGAGLNLAAGLMLGLLNFSGYVLPLEVMTLDLLRTEAMIAFVSSIGAGVGLFLVFCGIAALVRSEAVTPWNRPPARVRVRRGKSIYRGDPSAR